MRRYQEPVAVRTVPQSAAAPGLSQVPGQFIWNKRLWRVLGIQRHWVEAGAWWRNSGAVAGRGEAPGLSAGPGDPCGASQGVVVADPLGESSCWLVEAASGANGHTGVFELCCTGSDWVLRAVFD